MPIFAAERHQRVARSRSARLASTPRAREMPSIAIGVFIRPGHDRVGADAVFARCRSPRRASARSARPSTSCRRAGPIAQTAAIDEMLMMTPLFCVAHHRQRVLAREHTLFRLTAMIRSQASSVSAGDARVARADADVVVQHVDAPVALDARLDHRRARRPRS